MRGLSGAELVGSSIERRHGRAEVGRWCRFVFAGAEEEAAKAEEDKKKKVDLGSAASKAIGALFGSVAKSLEVRGLGGGIGGGL